MSRIEHSLALGIEPIDGQRGAPLAQPVDICLDGAPSPLPPRVVRERAVGGTADPSLRIARRSVAAWQRRRLRLGETADGRPRVPRHDSGVHVLLRGGGLKSPVAIRIDDPTRRFVPRRLRYAFPAQLETKAPLVRRPVLYPGAAYDVSESATGLRGRAVWKVGAKTIPARWVRVRVERGGQQLAHAHGDDRGEFLLLLGPAAGQFLPLLLTLDVILMAPIQPPDEAALAMALKKDPLADLPLEPVPPAAAEDGEATPDGYAGRPAVPIRFQPGRLLTGLADFVLNP